MADEPSPPPPPATPAEWDARFQAWEAEHAPAPLAERQASETAYEDLTPNQSLDLLEQSFPDYVSGLDEEILANPGDEVRKFVSDHVAIVDPAGPEQRELAVSTLPLKVEATDGGEQLADPDLEPTAAGYEPTAIGTDLSIPTDIDEGIELGDDGLELGVPEPEEASAARPVSGNAGLYYNDVAPGGVGLVVSPVTGGFSFALQILTADAPERTTLPLDLPDGGTLQVDEATGFARVEVDEGDDYTITAPVALDADQRPVPSHSWERSTWPEFNTADLGD